jgi:hypothetical protein
MTRFVVWLLVVSTLTLNMAWAVDNCAFSDPSESNTGLAQAPDPAPADSTSTIPACGHWCPGWMSLVALPGASVPLLLLSAGFEGELDAAPYFFLPAPPPTHPPIA